MVGLSCSFPVCWLLSRLFLLHSYAAQFWSRRGPAGLGWEKHWAVPWTELFLKEPYEGQSRGGQRASAIILLQGLATRKRPRFGAVRPGGEGFIPCLLSSELFMPWYHTLLQHSLPQFSEMREKLRKGKFSLTHYRMATWTHHYLTCQKSTSAFSPDNLSVTYKIT